MNTPSYLNESDVKDLEKQIAEVKKQLEESKAVAEAKADETKLTESKLRIAEDKYVPKNNLTLC